MAIIIAAKDKARTKITFKILSKILSMQTLKVSVGRQPKKLVGISGGGNDSGGGN
jgi:hypothetical protein